MVTISTTDLRAHISDVMDLVTHRGSIVGVERHNKVEAYLIPAPAQENPTLSEETNFNAASPSFAWLHDEPELYSRADCKVVYR